MLGTFGTVIHHSRIYLLYYHPSPIFFKETGQTKKKKEKKKEKKKKKKREKKKEASKKATNQGTEAPKTNLEDRKPAVNFSLSLSHHSAPTAIHIYVKKKKNKKKQEHRTNNVDSCD